MQAVYYLIRIAVIPIFFSVFFCILEKYTKFKKINYYVRQIIIGVIFGGIAMLATEYGFDFGGVEANIRDSAPLCAGLLFGSPAGLIAGFLGGIERWFATLWGAGEYTRLACSISTIIAGLIAALLRKFIFENRRPSCIYAFIVAIVSEISHMLMIFVVKINDPKTAFSVVKDCLFPMVVTNAVTVLIAVLIVALISKEKINSGKKQKNITKIFQRGLILLSIFVFLITTSFIFFLQNKLNDNDTNNLLKVNLEDVKQDILDASSENMLKLTQTVSNELIIREKNENRHEVIKDLVKKYDIAEISYIDKKGIIVDSSAEEYIGFDMYSGEQSRDFMDKIVNSNSAVQEYQPISSDSSISRKYAGISLRDGYIQVGYDAENFQKDIDSQIFNATKNRHIGENGFMLVLDSNWNYVSEDSITVETPEQTSARREKTKNYIEYHTYESEIYGQKCYFMYTKCEGYLIIAILPQEEALLSRDISIYLNIMMLTIVFAALFILVYFMIKKIIVDNINQINDDLSEITDGNLDVIVDVHTNHEFSSLSDDINQTVDTLKRYIEEAASRIDKELEFAKNIQQNALPSVFPPYPNRNEFEIYASMVTAKEVGGDFYDFYLLDDNHLVILIADVSDKGIPAAMFMMQAKTVLKNYAESGLSIDEIFNKANNKLCENNKADMFVTVWMGILDITTGVIEYVNAGHDYPAVRHNNGLFEFHKEKPNLVLACMEDMNYVKHEIKLEKGDEIFLYTDGVTEATSLDKELYGEDRLLNILNKDMELSREDVCKKVKSDIDGFVGEASQFDDITMLTLKLNIV